LSSSAAAIALAAMVSSKLTFTHLPARVPPH
jgi:hypothetical protein